MAGISDFPGLVDPMCGSGTFIFEGWMLLNKVAPNLNREFAFQHWEDYREDLHVAEREKLVAEENRREALQFVAIDNDEKVIELAKSIQDEHFPEAKIEWHHESFQDVDCSLATGLMVTNPPYGERLGLSDDLLGLYRDLGFAAKRMVPGGRLAMFTTNRKAAKQIRLKSEEARTLFNGALEGLLYQYNLRARD
jgi:23S rRNA (guanine2445-N2)-methyltransferase / 23S rRNA (guanine2069-N7)-methyltransferase